MTALSFLATLLALVLCLAGMTGPEPGTPSARPGATPDGSVATRVVTRADNGRMVTLLVGGRMLLTLGEGDWTVRIADPAILARIPNVATVRGSQGIYVAKRPGRASLSASMPDGTAFHVTIMVT